MENSMRNVAFIGAILGLLFAGAAKADWITLSASTSANVQIGPVPTAVPGALIVPGLQNIGLLQFDLSGIKSPVIQAELNLYGPSLTAPGGQVFNIYRNKSLWQASSVSWSSRPAYASTPVSTVLFGNPDGYRGASDVTAAVNAWITGAAPNFGFTIATADGTNPMYYIAASNAFSTIPSPDPNPVITPELILETASASSPEPTSLMLAAFGGMCLLGCGIGKNRIRQC